MPSQTPTPPAAETESFPHPLYNTTYTLHRLSPLHHHAHHHDDSTPTHPFLSAATLTQHAHSLHSILRGDVLRGVRVGFRLGDGAGENDDTANVDDVGAGKAGALKGCEWKVLGGGDGSGERRWKDVEEEGNTDGTGTGTGARTRTRTRTKTKTRSRRPARSAAAEEEEEEENAQERDGRKAIGIQIEIRYERTTYTALLLRAPPRAATAHQAEQDEGGEEEDPSSTHLPLLLTRMPAPLRSTLITYLSTTFDCRVSGLALSSAFILGALEGWFDDLLGHGGDGEKGPDAAVKEVVMDGVKDIHLTLSFAPPVAPALRTLEVVVQAEDVAGFVKAGRKVLVRQQEEGQGDGNGDGMARSRKRKRMGADREVAEEVGMGMEKGPFTAALAAYLKAHLALSFGSLGMDVVKIACGGFVLGAEGRVRISDLRRAAGDGDGENRGESGERAMRGLVARLLRRAKGGGTATAIGTGVGAGGGEAVEETEP